MIQWKLPKCYRKKGHKIDLIVPSFKRGDVTQSCRKCGIVRQFPVSVPPVPLDDLTADEIDRRIRGYSL